MRISPRQTADVHPAASTLQASPQLPRLPSIYSARKMPSPAIRWLTKFSSRKHPPRTHRQKRRTHDRHNICQCAKRPSQHLAQRTTKRIHTLTTFIQTRTEAHEGAVSLRAPPPRRVAYTVLRRPSKASAPRGNHTATAQMPLCLGRRHSGYEIADLRNGSGQG